MSQRGRATLCVCENLTATQGRSRSFEITPMSKPCVSSYISLSCTVSEIFNIE